MGWIWRRLEPGTDFVVDGIGCARPASFLALNAGSAKAVFAAVALVALLPANQVQDDLVSATASRVSEAAAMIQRRSPGLRKLVAFLKKKGEQAVARAKPRVPPRRAVASSRDPATIIVPAPPQPLSFSGAPLTPGPFDFATLPPRMPPVVDFTPIEPPNLPGPKELVFIPGTPGGIGPPPPGPPIAPPPRPPAIPEPSGWATMIAGFAMLGGLWRRRRVLVRMLSHIPAPRLAYRP